VDWTKGKNLIISSAANTATQLRGPYDVINLCSYLLGLPINRAKAAISTNPRSITQLQPSSIFFICHTTLHALHNAISLFTARSLILKALRKKHFYKETIRIDRLLPHEQSDSTKVMLSDWIGWDSELCKGDLPSSEANQLEPSSNKDQRPNSPIHGVIQESHCNPDVSVIAKPSEEPTSNNEISSQTKDETVQADVLMDRRTSILSTSLDHQDAGPYHKSGNNEGVLEYFVQPTSGHFVDPKSVDIHVEFDQDAMEVDATESCKLKLTVGNNVPSISESSIKLACSALPQGMEISGTNPEDKNVGYSSEILDDVRSYAQHHTDCVFDEREKTQLAYEISSGSVVAFENRNMDQSTDIPVDTEAFNGMSKLVECLLGGKDDNEPIDQSIDKDIEQIVEGEVESTDLKTRKDILVEPLFQGQGISSIGYTYHKRFADANFESGEQKEQSLLETTSSLDNNVAETHEQPLIYPYPISKVGIPTIKSGKIVLLTGKSLDFVDIFIYAISYSRICVLLSYYCQYCDFIILQFI
jgi:ribonuclease P/MRP protein subunit RPP1